jgi:hypothetical protein
MNMFNYVKERKFCLGFINEGVENGGVRGSIEVRLVMFVVEWIG